MEKAIINPWQWQYERSYVQAVEVKNANSTLYVSGQAAVHADGRSSNADMLTQLNLAIANLEEVISKAGYRCADIVRLTIYTTSAETLWPHFPVLQEWISRHGIQTAVTFMEVKTLFETLSVELEATAVR
ncbi:RidA family protein [Terrimonas sp. NA20]|uniref:RidA family protein n=1 Tax=Terrimonas ginsenosidimutans TaxID=2908004 RepID=A0ABS9KLY0_9BACT|nr:RidA family protein [Terrimonas ginsenosidimutans]MCG2613325.1 RidA family protein [Terrimonas ginsenosidimutans]